MKNRIVVVLSRNRVIHELNRTLNLSKEVTIDLLIRASKSLIRRHKSQDVLNHQFPSDYGMYTRPSSGFYISLKAAL